MFPRIARNTRAAQQWGNLRVSQAQARNRNLLSAWTNHATLFNSVRDEDENQVGCYQSRCIHMTARNDFRVTTPVESTSPVILAFGVAGIAFGGSRVIQLYDDWEKKKNAEAAKSDEGKDKESSSSSSWFNFSFGGARFYEGGFEDEMTKREAALILGIRESSPKKKVREAHRRLSLLNHPDTGGSTFLASKINEAKEKLLGSA